MRSDEREKLLKEQIFDDDRLIKFINILRPKGETKDDETNNR